MKKTIINSLLVIVVGVLIYTGIYQFIRLNVSSQKNEDSPISKVIETKTINVNGTLYYPAEKPDGYYTVWWMSTPRIHAAGNPIRSEDGEFSVDFFQNTGELVLMLGYSENPDPFAPSMALAEVPVEIGASDIELGTVELSELPEDIKYMDTFVGDTVRLEGELVMDDFTYGVFDIILASRKAWEKDNITPEADIDAIGPIRDPGAFSLELPRDFGEVFMMVTYYAIDGEQEIQNRAGNMPGVIRSYYSKNPIVVSNKDIKGIRIVFP